MLRNHPQRLALLAALIASVPVVVIAACDETTPTATRATAARGGAERSERATAEVNRELAALRAATARFHDFAAAQAAGYSAQITPCMVDPTAGGMGFHYGNLDLITDPSESVERPELLLYEPEQNGRLRLVGVEYIVPYALHSRDAAPPVLFGQEFKQVDAFQLWGLHAWVWDHNPSGMFADWNPRVTCTYATTVSTMTHR
jgi:hypothetical protein